MTYIILHFIKILNYMSEWDLLECGWNILNALHKIDCDAILIKIVDLTEKIKKSVIAVCAIGEGNMRFLAAWMVLIQSL